MAQAQAPVTVNVKASPVEARRPGGRALQRLRAHPLETIGLVGVVFAVFMGIFGPMLAPQDPYAVNFAEHVMAPSSSHLFGTDDAGRDVLSRVMYGARTTLSAVGLVLVIAATVGIVVGTVAATCGRGADELLMRVTDIGLSFPPLVLAIGLSAAFGGGLTAAIAAIAIAWWPGYARLVRTLVGECPGNPSLKMPRCSGSLEGG